MINNLKLQSLAALLIFGYIFIILLRYLEMILNYIFEIIALIVMPYSKYFDFYIVIPNLIVLGFWSFIVFRWLNKSDMKIDLLNDFPKKIVKQIGILVLALFVLQFGLSFLMDHLRETIRGNFGFDYKLLSIKNGIIMFLGLAEIIIIILGLFKIIGKTTGANKELS